ncbi:unnamed protein product [Ectocarpus sp. 4 AP-2014]
MLRPLRKSVVILAVAGGCVGDKMPMSRREELREEVLGAFHHAYQSYVTYAYPADELMPLSCTGRGWQRRTRGTIDDALGGYALTMIDSLDMHAVVGDGEGFRRATATLLRDFESGVLAFDRDVVVSVFEASIRVLGGLLSAHQIATELGPSGRLGPPGWYGGELLSLAHDLGRRLLPAFDTPLGIPVHRVNLRKGVPRGETRDTCSAAAGTFLVEFGALSRLTGDPSFEAAARRAVGALWERRSPLGLVGGGVKGSTGKWDSRTASIGAGTDSFYEYLDKSARLFRDAEMKGMFREAYAGVEENLVWGRWHVEVDMWKGKGNPSNYRVSSLQAFWPAVQAGAGSVEAAERTYDALFELWEEYDALPDFYDVLNDRLLHYGRDSPLRPELAESTLALYRATGSAKYLRAGEDLLSALQSNSRVACGYASVGDVDSSRLDDRMDSFFIAETLKYLFLLFDSSLPAKNRKSIFCTPEQEDEVLNHHARRSAAAAAVAANATSNAAAAANTTAGAGASASSSGLFSEVGGGPASAAAAPVTVGGADGAKDDERGSGVEPAHWPYAPRCLLWSDTVLSTEGHPFLASALAPGGATAAAASSLGNGGGGRCGDSAVVDLGRDGDGDVGRHYLGERTRVCSPPSPSTSSSSSPSVPLKLSSNTQIAEGLFQRLVDRALRASGGSEGAREWKRADTATLDGTTTTTTAAAAGAGPGAGKGGRDEHERNGGGGELSRLSSFDPRHHYSRAVRSEEFVSRPKDAELDVKCRHTSKGRPTCDIHAIGPGLRAHMTSAVGEKLWPKAVLRVMDWVRDTVFSQEQGQQQQQQEDDQGSSNGNLSKKTRLEGAVYRLHQVL